MAAERDATSGEQQGSGYLVGSDVRAIFAGALNFREQCDAAGILYKDLDSGCDDDDVGMMVEEEAEEAGRDVCAHVCSHNDRCEVCDEGGDGVLPCDFCNLVYHTGCLEPPLTLADDEDVDFACPLCVAGRRAGHEDTGVVAADAHDAAAEAGARHARDEAVRREHTAIEQYRRGRSGAAPTRGIPPRGEPMEIVADDTAEEEPARRRVQRRAKKARVGEGSPAGGGKDKSKGGKGKGKGSRGGAHGGSAKRENEAARIARS
jgi:hypothetical protein